MAPGEGLILPLASGRQRHCPWGSAERIYFADGSNLDRVTAYYRPPVEFDTNPSGEVTSSDPARVARLLTLGEIAAKEPELAKSFADFLGESVIPEAYLR